MLLVINGALIVTVAQLVLGVVVGEPATIDWSRVNLPEEHVPYYFQSHPDLRYQCSLDHTCPYRNLSDVVKCWGYEVDCRTNNTLWMSTPLCTNDVPLRWPLQEKTRSDQFWKDVDFGYVAAYRNRMRVFCDSRSDGESQRRSYFACSQSMTYCRARNIFMNFTELHAETSTNSFRKDVFQRGQLGGVCDVFKDGWKDEPRYTGDVLQSWYSELSEYAPIDADIATKCDVVIDKPTVLMKLDYGGNMYHHFCDFFNLYISQHVAGAFNTDINIIMWDTGSSAYFDGFREVWPVFTDYPVIHLNTFSGKTICISDAVFSTLPRMPFGLFYSTPVVPGCHGSSLFRAFSQHVLHRLRISQQGPLEKRLRVTFMLRRTAYRRIVNEDQLINALDSISDYQVRPVMFDFNYPFRKQLQVVHNSDILIGIHGAGLTHVLFQPDWGAMFELYNCGDDNCYKDLSNLRGVQYLTWENKSLLDFNEPELKSNNKNEKFTNYSFDVGEFMRLVKRAADHVRSHPLFNTEWKNKYGNLADKDEL